MAKPAGRTASRRLVWLLVLPISLLFFTLAYMALMNSFEGSERNFWDSLEWAAETLTTTGYGNDADWDHPITILFVIAAQYVGLFMVFLLFPILVIPYIEQRFEKRLPRDLPENLRDVVLIYRHGPAVTSLIDDMAREDISCLILEEDEALARRLRDRGLDVVLVDVDDAADAGFGPELAAARAIVLNGEDHKNAVLLMSARENGYEGPVCALVGDPLHRRPLLVAGATAVYSPKHALAEALAAQASDRISPRVAGIQQLGDAFRVAELRVDVGSALAGKTIGESRIRESTGATIVGQWIGGHLDADVAPETRLQGGAIVVAVGTEEALERLGAKVTGQRRRGPILVAGFGEVGRKVVEMLSAVGQETVVINERAVDGVDFVADARDSKALLAAGVRAARAVVLALSSDSANLFEAAIVRDLAPDVPIIARVNRAEEVERIHAAGADFALSIGQVAGQLLGRELFGEEFISIEPRMRIAKASAAGLVGKGPPSLHVRERTGCVLVAIERGADLDFEFGRDFVIEKDDALYLCGAEEAIARFFDVFPSARSGGEPGSS